MVETDEAQKTEQSEEGKQFSRCESGKHREEIPPESILTQVWKLQQEKGQKGDLIIPDISCEACNKERNSPS